MFKKIFTRGVVDLISEKGLKKRLESGKKLRIKLGVDPSSPDIHLGHCVALRQLKKFQDSGHTVIFLIGDYTAMVGDPSGKNKTRPVLTEEQINENAQTYLDQVNKVLDINKVEIRKNSEWFKKLNIQDLIRLGSHFSVAQIIERDDFEKRLKSGNEISMHELLYPMMQAYDSVMLEADIEIGGTDQRFNILAGRELQKKSGQVPQDIILTELLIGLDGKNKMSKSLGNYVGVNDNPDDKFGKIMSITDNMIIKYFQLCTDVSDIILDKYQYEMEKGKNPRDYKERLAYEIVKLYDGEEIANQAKNNFINQFQKGKLPDDIKEVHLIGRYDIVLLLNNIGLERSNSEIRRLIEQGAVKIDGLKIIDDKATITVYKGMVIQVGKRHFWKIK